MAKSKGKKKAEKPTKSDGKKSGKEFIDGTPEDVLKADLPSKKSKK